MLSAAGWIMKTGREGFGLFDIWFTQLKMTEVGQTNFIIYAKVITPSSPST
jgi:hypothetical protein